MTRMGLLYLLQQATSNNGNEFAHALEDTLKQDYVVLATNDLGMHCLNPDYQTAVILPPYNNLRAQVIKRGNPPQIVSDGITLNYSIDNNTSSADKEDYGSFWDYVKDLFGVSLEDDTGLTGNKLSGTMDISDDLYQAEGIPVTPVDDSGDWDPYQVAVITATDADGNLLAETRTTLPVSDEINCSKCHDDESDPFLDVLKKHDSSQGTTLVSQTPILCANCHGSPALGGDYANNRNGATKYLSEAIHGSHANRDAGCYDCHPGNQTQCNRSTAHTASEGNCTSCHGDMSEISSSIASSERIPWVNEPACSQCHTGSGSTLTTVTTSTSSSIADVDTSSTLYRNAKGHGGVLCAGCHGTPHAMVPTSKDQDNYQNNHYQGSHYVLGDCRTCHSSSRGADEDEFQEEHGGSSPRVYNACHVCHTGISGSESDWPHSFQWKSRK